MASERFENLEKQRDDVFKALCRHHLTHDVAVWLADLHIRVRECELSLLNHGMATEQPLAAREAEGERK